MDDESAALVCLCLGNEAYLSMGTPGTPDQWLALGWVIYTWYLVPKTSSVY